MQVDSTDTLFESFGTHGTSERHSAQSGVIHSIRIHPNSKIKGEMQGKIPLQIASEHPLSTQSV
jgi:hypothetical protein